MFQSNSCWTLLRVIILLVAVGMSGCAQWSANERHIVGIWKNDASDPSIRFNFKSDHSFTAGNSTGTFITGAWKVKKDHFVISHVKAAGKPVTGSDGWKKLLSVTENQFVLQSNDSPSGMETYIRVR